MRTDLTSLSTNITDLANNYTALDTRFTAFEEKFEQHTRDCKLSSFPTYDFAYRHGMVRPELGTPSWYTTPDDEELSSIDLSKGLHNLSLGGMYFSTVSDPQCSLRHPLPHNMTRPPPGPPLQPPMPSMNQPFPPFPPFPPNFMPTPSFTPGTGPAQGSTSDSTMQDSEYYLNPDEFAS